MPTLMVIAVASYLLGSIPFGYLLVRIFRGEDVRQSGSGNIGATNVSRKSPALGAVTLGLDALKGTSAVMLAYRLSGGTWGRPKPYLAMAVAALFAVVGHIFPVWLRFRGGKGVATALGSFLVITPKAVLIAAVIFVLVVLVFRYVSLGSIVAAASFPLLLLKGMPKDPNALSALVCTAVTSLLIIARHHENIRRLLGGTENRLGGKRP
ncbi:MAG TPA: glycerol-3-phosphate 1-O-acyltransferase PlsY [Candidatus Aquilonibacter sp.]|nr:glycerol-3-phosphate 1-O-acyltransferase PlsY [Candidatus Aquilonibacter sp.]